MKLIISLSISLMARGVSSSTWKSTYHEWVIKDSHWQPYCWINDLKKYLLVIAYISDVKRNAEVVQKTSCKSWVFFKYSNKIIQIHLSNHVMKFRIYWDLKFFLFDVLIHTKAACTLCKSQYASARTAQPLLPVFFSVSINIFGIPKLSCFPRKTKFLGFFKGLVVKTFFSGLLISTNLEWPCKCLLWQPQLCLSQWNI